MIEVLYKVPIGLWLFLVQYFMNDATQLLLCFEPRIPVFWLRLWLLNIFDDLLLCYPQRHVAYAYVFKSILTKNILSKLSQRVYLIFYLNYSKNIVAQACCVFDKIIFKMKMRQ